MKPITHIKSFVIRQGHMSQAQKNAIKNLWPIYGIDLKPELLNFEAVFERKAPTVLEIGFGNGDTLISLAQKYPEKNFIGIDVHKPGVGSLLILLEKYNLKNVKLFCADAIEALNQMIADTSLASVYVLFPDPWPKRKHHKRRLVNPNFLELIEKKLIKKGHFFLATDWEEYAEHMELVFSENEHFQKSDQKSERPTTRFETRGKRLGHGVWDFSFKKK